MTSKSEWFPTMAREVRMDANPFSLLFSNFIIGDLIIRKNPQTGGKITILVLKNRKRVAHFLYMEENVTKTIRYLPSQSYYCQKIIREGNECNNFPELLRASK